MVRRHKEGYGVRMEKLFWLPARFFTNGSLPLFICEAVSIKCDKATTAVARVLSSFEALTKHNWSGLEFFRFHRSDELKFLSVKNVDLKRLTQCKIKQIQNICSRNARPTSELKSKSGIMNRNTKIDEMVEFVSFDDIKSTLFYLFIY